MHNVHYYVFGRGLARVIQIDQPRIIDLAFICDMRYVVSSKAMGDMLSVISYLPLEREEVPNRK